MAEKRDVNVIFAAVLLPPMITLGLFALAKGLSGTPQTPLSNEMGDAANWTQVLVTLWAMAVAAVAAYQIVILRRQTQIQERMAEMAVYRPLISPTSQSIKRFIASAAFQAEITRLRTQVLPTLQAGAASAALDVFRARVAVCASAVALPLMDRPASLDHVESLVNEYNYICKQILERVVSADFATEMSVENIRNVHDRLLPFLELRRRLSPRYGKHFSDYVERSSSAQGVPRNR